MLQLLTFEEAQGRSLIEVVFTTARRHLPALWALFSLVGTNFELSHFVKELGNLH